MWIPSVFNIDCWGCTDTYTHKYSHALYFQRWQYEGDFCVWWTDWWSLWKNISFYVRYPIIFTNICPEDTAYYLNVSLLVPLSRSCPKDEFSLSFRGKDNFKPSVLSCCFLRDVRYRALQTDSQTQIRKNGLGQYYLMVGTKNHFGVRLIWVSFLLSYFSCPEVECSHSAFGRSGNIFWVPTMSMPCAYMFLFNPHKNSSCQQNYRWGDRLPQWPEVIVIETNLGF